MYCEHSDECHIQLLLGVRQHVTALSNIRTAQLQHSPIHPPFKQQNTFSCTLSLSSQNTSYIMFVYSLLDHGLTILFQGQQQQRQHYHHLVTVIKIDVDNYLKISSNICREPLGKWRFRHWAVVPVVLSPGHVQCHRWRAR